MEELISSALFKASSMGVYLDRWGPCVESKLNGLDLICDSAFLGCVDSSAISKNRISIPQNRHQAKSIVVYIKIH